MKGISQWVWIVGSIISAVIIFTIAINQMLLANRSIIEQRSIDQFNEIASNLNNLCWEFAGRKAELTVNLGDMVEGIYAAETPYDKYEKEQLINNIILNKNSTGKYLCLKITDKRLNCKQFECNVSFPFIGYVPEKFSLSALINSLMGKGKIYTYLLTLWRVPNGIDVYLVETAPTTTTITTTTTIPGLTTTTTPTPQQCKPEELVKLVDSNEMIKNINYLIQNPRPYKSNWNKQTADYIKTTLESYSLDNVYFEDFNSGNGRNVIGELGSGSNVIIVTGGHRDGVSNCPAAVDNAAGTATVMEAARVLAACKSSIKNYKIKFVLFDGEELGMYGSHAYVNAHSNENIQRMFNFDCLGLKGSSGLTIFRTAKDLSDSSDKACQSLGINCDKRGQAPGNSDHSPFDDANIPYLWAINYGYTCGACYHCYSCTDDISQIDGTRMEWAGKLTVYVLADLYLG